MPAHSRSTAAARCCLRQQSVAVHCNVSPPARLPYPFLSSASRVITQFLLTHRFAALCDGTFDTDRTFGVFCKLCTTRKNIRKKLTNYYNEKKYCFNSAIQVLFTVSVPERATPKLNSSFWATLQLTGEDK